MTSWFARLRNAGLGTHSLALLLAVTLCYVVVAPVAGLLSGAAGLITAAVAAALCLSGAEAALVICRVLRDAKYSLYGLLGGMFPRMGIPIVLGLILQIRGGMLAESGLLIYLVVFYPVTLGLETALSLPSADGTTPTANVPRDLTS